VTNQRQMTAIVYLNDGYEGGETVFPELDLTVPARRGDMLLFANLKSDGQSDNSSRHAGRPVASGRKWIATRWIRQRRYHPWLAAD
jgi:prolyl 4-hydroxylase